MTVVLPREVALHLRGGRVHEAPQPTVPAPETSPVDASRVDRVAAGAAADVVRLVDELLELWSTEPPKVLRAGGVGVRERARAATALDLDEPALALLAEVAQAAGLLGSGDDGSADAEVWLPTPAYDGWLDEPVEVRWATLARAWLTTTRVAGLAGSQDVRGRTLAPLGPDLDRTVAPVVRAGVLGDLAALPVGTATTTASLTARLRWHAPRRGGRLHDDLVGWTVREGERLGLLSGGALAVHGRALVEGRPDDAVGALAALLPAPLDHVLLQADLTAVAPGPLEPGLARSVRLVADVESTGGATVYRFTEATVRRAFDAGWTAGDVTSLLTKHSRTPVPQPLTYLVEDVARRHGRVRVGAASSFVRCDDEATLGVLLSDRKVSSLGLRRIAPTVLASTSPPDVVLERLREAGWHPPPRARTAPSWSGGPSRAARPSAGARCRWRRPRRRRRPTRCSTPRCARSAAATGRARSAPAARRRTCWRCWCRPRAPARHCGSATSTPRAGPPSGSSSRSRSRAATSTPTTTCAAPSGRSPCTGSPVSRRWTTTPSPDARTHAPGPAARRADSWGMTTTPGA